MNNQRQKLIEEFVAGSLKIKRFFEQISTISLEEKIATMLQMQALEYLNNNHGSTVSELAQNLFVSSSSTAQLTDRLVTSGWIKRENDKSDRRIIRLILTSKGEEELSGMRKKRVEKLNGLLSYLSDHDLSEMVRIQTKLVDAVEKKQ